MALANMVTSLMLTAFAADSTITAARLGFDLLCAFAGGLLVAATTSFLLPVLEPLLSVTTDIKLLELSDTNLPLLRRLAFEAPGTFQHSLMVANLAKEGCEAIGANPVLAYTGGLYHDIGSDFAGHGDPEDVTAEICRDAKCGVNRARNRLVAGVEDQVDDCLGSVGVLFLAQLRGQSGIGRVDLAELH